MSVGKVIGLGLGAVSVAAVLTVVFGSWYHVEEGHRGVVLRNGAYSTLANPGLNFKLPIIDSVRSIELRDAVVAYPMQAYSRDQQVADLTVTVQYRVDPSRVRELYTQYGSTQNAIERLITRSVNDSVKNVFGRFNAQSSIQERERLGQEMNAALQASIGDNSPIIVSRLNVEDISFSDAYEASIEQRMQAEIEVQRREQELAREVVQAEITVTQAQADSVLAGAQARAEATRIQGEAEAAAIEARGQALRDNPNLVQLVQAENWDGRLPTTMLPNGTVPIIDAVPTQVGPRVTAE